MVLMWRWLRLLSVGLVAGSLLPAHASVAGRLTPTRSAELYGQAHAASDSGNFAEAAARFDEVAGSSSALRTDAFYAAATNYARAGLVDRAFDALFAALAAGYRDHIGLDRDAALAGLRSDPRWEAALARVAANDIDFRERHSDPRHARLITTDIRLLLSLLPLTPGEEAQAERVERTETEYIDRGSDGLVAFLAYDKILSVDFLAGTIAALPRLYASLDHALQALERQTPDIRSALVRMKELYPATFFPDVYFVVGHFRSGGTSTTNGLIVGTEIFARTPGVVLDEISVESRAIVQPVEQIASVVVHELTHFQQPSLGDTPTLLQAAIAEGTADFVASLVLPGTPEPEYRTWGRAHDRRVRERFQTELHGTDLSAWIANNDRATEDWPAALGYYVGFRIAAGFYERAPDKSVALQRLLLLEDPEEMLRLSGYLE